MSIEIKELSGKDIEPFIKDLARLRIQVFHDFPYLYDGDLDYEKKYLSVYTESEKSLAVLVFDNQKLVGASTALPLSDESEEFQKPFLDKGYDIEKIFYFGESILLSEYRGRGLGKDFFSYRESHAKEVMPHLNFTCFCAVNRPDDHPLKPSTYKPLNEFWKSRGYEKHPELECYVEWKDRDKSEEDKKSLSFWLKPF